MEQNTIDIEKKAGDEEKSMKLKSKRCPLKLEFCSEIDCAWWDVNQKQCVMVSIYDALRDDLIGTKTVK